MKKPLKKSEADPMNHPADPIEAAQKVIADETHATVPLSVVGAAIGAYEAARRKLPETRCGKCDNGVDVIWHYCPWCGAKESWASRRPGPHHGQAG